MCSTQTPRNPRKRRYLFERIVGMTEAHKKVAR
jgi:hypothetical protein